VNRLAFLFALAVLVINDHVLKGAYPGFVTGKLSDFAGVFALAVFLAFVLPRKYACVAAGVLFVWWKSPLSQPFIDALPWEAARVVDWTDLFALTMLPLAYRCSPAQSPRPQRAVLAVLSALAFAATTPARSDVPIPEGHPLRNYDTGRTRGDLRTLAKPCKLHFVDNMDHSTELWISWEHFRLVGPNPQANARARVEIVDGKARLRFDEIRIEWEDNPDPEAYRRSLLRRLDDCVKK
jgi:hypothetical protein